MSLRQGLVGGAVAGAGVPAFCWIVSYFLGFGFSRWTFYVWPSSIILLAANGHERTGFGLLALAIAVLGDVVFYMLVGAIIWFFIFVFQRTTKGRAQVRR